MKKRLEINIYRELVYKFIKRLKVLISLQRVNIDIFYFYLYYIKVYNLIILRKQFKLYMGFFELKLFLKLFENGIEFFF